MMDLTKPEKNLTVQKVHDGILLCCSICEGVVLHVDHKTLTITNGFQFIGFDYELLEEYYNDKHIAECKNCFKVYNRKKFLLKPIMQRNKLLTGATE